MEIKEIEGLALDTYAGKAAAACRNKLYGILGNSGHDILAVMDAVMYIMLHDRFASKGFFITKDNKEDMYIKILESGDMDLFADLEKYISYLDKVGAMTEKIDEYNSLIDQLKCNATSDEATINDIVGEYLRR